MLGDEDVIAIKVEQELLGEEVLNIFYFLYELGIIGVTLVDLLSEFKLAVWDLVRIGQHPDVSTINMQAQNLTNGVDVDDLPLSDIGVDTTGGDVLPSSTAAGYVLNVGSRETRPGGKRIAGISDARVTDNAYDAGGTISADIEDAFAVSLDVSGLIIGEGVLIPYVVGRDLLGIIDLNRIQPIASAAVSALIRTQTSRRAN